MNYFTRDDLYRSVIRDAYAATAFPHQGGKNSFRMPWRKGLEPRPGFIDARRDDGCIPLITTVEA